MENFRKTIDALDHIRGPRLSYMYREAAIRKETITSRGPVANKLPSFHVNSHEAKRFRPDGSNTTDTEEGGEPIVPQSYCSNSRAPRRGSHRFTVSVWHYYESRYRDTLQCTADPLITFHLSGAVSAIYARQASLTLLATNERTIDRS